jgi:hypothetical protein
MRLAGYATQDPQKHYEKLKKIKQYFVAAIFPTA